MRDLHWIDGLPGECTDLVDGDGTLRGYIGPHAGGPVRAYTLRGEPTFPPRFGAIKDCGSPDEARAWVEAEVAARRSLQENGGGHGG